MLMWIEFGLVIGAVALAMIAPEIGSKFFQSLGQKFSQVARQKKRTIVIVGLLALASRAALVPILITPRPHINDEFGHLLLADTLAHGRLANPTPAMWRHFETFHVLMRPTYVAIYPPAQGLALAIGEKISHLPFIGVWLSVGAMCAAICWMLQGWVSAELALLGAFIAIIRLGTFSYWANSYWGGAVAATGGALIFGALPRIFASERRRDAIILGIGLAILANSRPYEGLILSLPVAISLLAWFFLKKTTTPWETVRGVFLPLALVLVIAALLTGFYLSRATGSPFRMPEMIDRETNAVAPFFMWQSPKPEPRYQYENIRRYYTQNELNFYKSTRTLKGAIAVSVVKIVHFWFFFLGPVLTLPFIIAVATLKNRPPRAVTDWKTPFLIATVIVCSLGIAGEIFFFPHYVAPMVGFFYILMAMAISKTYKYRWRAKPVGLFLVSAIPAIMVLMFALRACAPLLSLSRMPDFPLTWCNDAPVETERARIGALLTQYPGTHLAVVRYKENSQSEYDWVYNDAKIDDAKIIWARDAGPSQNKELINYYPERKVWLVEPDEVPAKISPYSE
jgi:Flp pilus assembly pilin Flp